MIEQRLDELCELIVDCPHSTPEWTASGYLVIRNQNIRGGRLDLSDRSFTNRRDFEHRIRRAKPQGGDIIFTREAPMGEVCLVPDGLECCVGQRQVLLRPSEDVDGRYLFYALQSPAVRHQILWNEGTGSTVSNVRIPILKDLKIPRRPGLEPAIGKLLALLDDKIELNRQTNDTLEAMAQAIFRDWFVDFGPVHRKMAGAIDPVEIVGGVTANAAQAAELADLFPRKLGEQDQAWEAAPFLTLAKLISGGTPATDQANYWNGPIAWASAKDVSQCGEAFLIETERSITELGLLESSTKIVSKHSTVVVARGATTGRFCMFGRDIAMNQTCYGLGSRTGTPFWLNCAFRALVKDLVQSAHGSVFDTITTATFENATVVRPPDALLRAFEDLVQPLFGKILCNLEESQTLAETRDYLLPRLMSGEVRVGEAAKEIAA